MLAFRSVVSVLVSFVRSFSTNSRPALRAACGRPPARQRHDDHPGTGLTLPTRWSRSSHEYATQATLGQQHGSLAAPSAAWQPDLGARSLMPYWVEGDEA
jgi:hypothetical protein